jgi:hypothetical protein
MFMTRRTFKMLALLGLAGLPYLAAGCGGTDEQEQPSAPAGEQPDGATADGSGDGAAQGDSSKDAKPDATADAPAEAKPDSSVDAPSETGADVAQDSPGPTDAGADGGSDAPADGPAKPDAGSDADADGPAKPDAGSDADAAPPPVVCDGSWGTTYYVRPDGGTASQCTGLVNAAYPGSGTKQPCAFSHPFIALPPDGTPILHGGDRLIIGAGHYRMGHGAPGTGGLSSCASAQTWDCRLPPVPSGPDPAHPTCIVGEGWTGTCAAPPELYAVERPWALLDLTGSNNVRVECLELTDHSGCVSTNHPTLACPNYYTFPHGDYGLDGVHASDSHNVVLKRLNVHGFPFNGFRAYRLTDWTLEDVRIAGNGLAGWDGDMGGQSVSNAGTMTFRRVTIEWNGCGETYPGGQPTGCWGQDQGGYGDGLGTGSTGAQWVFEDSSFLHNTSDGLDLLYHNLGGSIVVDRVRAEGNAGNQIKVTGNATIRNSVLVGNCAFFQGKPFTYGLQACRALGTTVAMALMAGSKVTMVSSTLYGQGDGILFAGPHSSSSCNGTESIVSRNNIFVGDVDFTDPNDRSVLFYRENCGTLALQQDYGVVWGTRTNSQSTCPMGTHDICQDPKLTGPMSGNVYGMVPLAGSPAIDTGLGVGQLGLIPAVDFLGKPRPAGSGVDRGAYEIQP